MKGAVGVGTGARGLCAVVAVAALMYASGCGDEEKKDDAGGSEVEGPTYTDGERIAETIGEAGAKLVLGSDAMLKIPSGALENDVDVRMQRTTLEALELDASELPAPLVSDVIEIAPGDTELAAGAELTLRVTDEGADPEALSVLKFRKGNWELFLAAEAAPPDDGDLSDLPKGERNLRSSLRMEIDTVFFGVYAVVEGEAPPMGDGGVGDGGGTGGAGILSLPFDFGADCAAGGCTLQLEPRAPNGLFRRCYPENPDPANFDPASFDFEAACMAMAARDASDWFVHAGDEFFLADGGGCSVQTAGLTAEETYLRAACRPAALEASFPAKVLIQGDRYYAYDYQDCSGSCTPTLSVFRLMPEDTGERADGCLSGADLEDLRCGDRAGELKVPFAPADLGSLPAALEGEWRVCGRLESPFDDTELETLCSNAAAAPSQLVRLNADGTRDDVALEGEAGAQTVAGGQCGARVDGDDTRLRIFAFTGENLVAAEFGYELRASEAFLVVEDAVSGLSTVHARGAFGDYVSGEPCDSLPSASVVLE